MNWRPFVVLAVLAFVGWLGYEIARAGGDVIVPRIQGQDKLTRGSIHGKRIDGRAWSLDFDTVTMTPDATQATIAHVRDGRIKRPGKPDVTMTADDVSVNRITNDFVVRGPVSFVEPEAGGRVRRFTTVGARYAGGTHILELQHPATITEGTTKIVVDRATVDFRTGNITFGAIEGTRS